MQVVPVRVSILINKASSLHYDLGVDRAKLVYKPPRCNNDESRFKNLFFDDIQPLKEPSPQLISNAKLNEQLSEFVAGHNSSIFTLNIRDPVARTNGFLIFALKRLQAILATSPTTPDLNYLHLGITDFRCIDLADERNLQLPFLKSNLHSLFRPAESIQHLIETLEKPITLPYFLLLRLENKSHSCSLCLADLGWTTTTVRSYDPRIYKSLAFSNIDCPTVPTTINGPPSAEVDEPSSFNVGPILSKSFDNLHNLVTKLQMLAYHSQIDESSCFLSLLTTENLIGNRRVLWLIKVDVDDPQAFVTFKFAETLRKIKNIYSVNRLAYINPAARETTKHLQVDLDQLNAAYESLREKHDETCRAREKQAHDCTAATQALCDLRTLYDETWDKTRALGSDLEAARETGTRLAFERAAAHYDLQCRTYDTQRRLGIELLCARVEGEHRKIEMTLLETDFMRIKVQLRDAVSELAFQKEQNADLEAKLGVFVGALEADVQVLLACEETGDALVAAETKMQAYSDKIIELRAYVAEVEACAKTHIDELREKSAGESGALARAQEALVQTLREGSEEALAQVRKKLAQVEARETAGVRKFEQTESEARARIERVRGESEKQEAILRAAIDSEARERRKLAVQIEEERTRRSIAQREADSQRATVAVVEKTYAELLEKVASESKENMSSACDAVDERLGLRREKARLEVELAAARMHAHTADKNRIIVESTVRDLEAQNKGLEQVACELKAELEKSKQQIAARHEALNEASRQARAATTSLTSSQQQLDLRRVSWTDKERSLGAKIEILVREKKALQHTVDEHRGRLRAAEESILSFRQNASSTEVATNSTPKSAAQSVAANAALMAAEARLRDTELRWQADKQRWHDDQRRLDEALAEIESLQQQHKSKQQEQDAAAAAAVVASVALARQIALPVTITEKAAATPHDCGKTTSLAENGYGSQALTLSDTPTRLPKAITVHDKSESESEPEPVQKLDIATRLRRRPREAAAPAENKNRSPLLTRPALTRSKRLRARTKGNALGTRSNNSDEETDPSIQPQKTRLDARRTVAVVSKPVLTSLNPPPKQMGKVSLPSYKTVTVELPAPRPLLVANGVRPAPAKVQPNSVSPFKMPEISRRLGGSETGSLLGSIQKMAAEEAKIAACEQGAGGPISQVPTRPQYRRLYHGPSKHSLSDTPDRRLSNAVSNLNENFKVQSFKECMEAAPRDGAKEGR